MGKKKSLSLRVWMFLTVISIIGVVYTPAAYSEPPDAKPVADEVVNASGISFLPKVNCEQLHLFIARPDGTVFNKVFPGGSQPYIDLSSICTGNSCDGSYIYELRGIAFNQKKVRGEEPTTETAPVQEALTQSGHFMVLGGAIVSQKNTEKLAQPMDVVHADDVIITGSLCVGFDCLTDGSESFGFDTIKMKENNIQIYFDDTSTTAGFPANDWRLVANDSSSGGSSYFALNDSTGSKTPFKVMAGARTSSIFVSSTGRVGFGTATPVLNLHIVHGDTPSVRLDQDTSSGWTAQVWDIAGNESNFFIRDTTGGSKLPFRIQPGTPTNTITLKAAADDDPYRVGIGTWSPTYPLELDTTGSNAAIAVKRTDGATCYINATDSFANFGSVTNHPFRLVVNSAWKMRLDSDNSLTMASGATCTAGGTWTDSSSRALKENIQSLGTEEALNALNNLNPVKFTYKAEKGEKHVGFIAEDAPELVATKDRKGMSPMDVAAVLTKMVQEQQKSIREQQKALQEQQKTITELKAKIAELEKK